MGPSCLRLFCLTLLLLAVSQTRAQSSSSTSKPHSLQKQRDGERPKSLLDWGVVSAGEYRNKTLGFTCKIPEGWVLRTDEMNLQEDAQSKAGDSSRAALDRTLDLHATPNPGVPGNPTDGGCPHNGCGRVLLAAFSRPPEARGEEVNASIVIAAEPAATYPGLKDAAQYFEPLTEVAKAQGFTVDDEPYGIAIGMKTLVRGDFHKDVGSRVMRQSTLAMLSQGYAVSFTAIAGTEDQVEELIDGLNFATVDLGGHR